MKFYHISDLHLGRGLNGYDLLEDQEYVLNDIIDKLVKEKAKYLLIPGDIFDKFNPSNEAANLFNEFLNKLVEKKIKTVIISGNHDSKDRLNYLSGFLKKFDIYISTKVNALHFPEDNISFFLIPFYQPEELKHLYSDMGKNVEEIYKNLVNEFFKDPDTCETKICLCHNMIIGGESSSSERIVSVGGVDSINASIFDGFNYVALGHLHKIQKIKDNIRYSGSILKYSVDEFNNHNSMLVYDSSENSVINLELNTKHKYRRIKNDYDSILEDAKNEVSAIGEIEDYIDIELTNELPVKDAHSILSGYYKRIVGFLNGKPIVVRRMENESTSKDNIDIEDIQSVFSNFYTSILGTEVSEEEQKIINDVISEINMECDTNEN